MTVMSGTHTIVKCDKSDYSKVYDVVIGKHSVYSLCCSFLLNFSFINKFFLYNTFSKFVIHN